MEECIKKKISEFLKIVQNQKKIKLIVITNLILTCLLFSELIIFGKGSPDNLCEGVYYYTNANWHLQCGRWAVRYLNLICFHNFVLPVINILIYSLCICLISYIHIKLWKVENNGACIIISGLLLASPAVISQSLYMHVFTSWAVSNLLVSMGIYMLFECKNSKKASVFLLSFFAIAMGLYQTVLGYICVIYLMTIILKIFESRSLKVVIKDSKLFYFIFAIIGGLGLYFLILKEELWRYGITASSRVKAFSFKSVFENIYISLKVAYKNYFIYFADEILNRNIVYFICIGIMCLTMFLLFYKMWKSGKKLEVISAGLLVLLIPLCSNIYCLALPNNPITELMNYQNVFLLVFAVVIIDRYARDILLGFQFKQIIMALNIVIIWTYIVSANATYISYELSYRYQYEMASTVLNKVYDLEEYEQGDAIIFTAFFDEDELRNNNPIFEYGVHQTDNAVYWITGWGLQSCRKNFYINYFGINPGDLDKDKYTKAIHSREYKEMPVYPKNGSIKKFDDMIIIKVSEVTFEL